MVAEAPNLFKRCALLLGEKIVQDQTPKASKNIVADSLQNPSAPYATYPRKGNKSYIGYILNLVEAYDWDKNLSLIVHQQLGPMW